MRIRDVLVVGISGLCGFYAVPVSAGEGWENGAAARGVLESHVVHERLEPAHTEGWAKRELPEAGTVLPIRIALRQSNVDAGHDLLMDISDPRSPNYGKHLTRDEVVNFFAPEQRSVEAVKWWLTSSGIDERRLSQSANKQWIQFDAPVNEVEQLLLTKYEVYEHSDLGVRSIACEKYHVPRNVSEHIDYITPGIKLVTGGTDERVVKRMMEHYRRRKKRDGRNRKGKSKEKRKRKCKSLASVAALEGPMFKVRGLCSDQVTPQCIRAQYQIPNGTKATPGNELGIFQSLSQHYSQQDLNTYWKHVTPWVPQNTFPKLRSINGAYGPANDILEAGEEADLDFQVAIPLIWPQKSILFQTDDEWYQQEQSREGTRYPGFFNTFFDALDASYCTLSAFNLSSNCAAPACRDPEYPNPNAGPELGGYRGPLMCGAHAPTPVLAVSYSGTEHSWPANYMRRQCLEVMKLGLMGVTVVESSGDFGVGGTRWDARGGCLGENGEVYAPRVMGNCPYVLSVGATVLEEPPDGTVGDGLEEAAAEGFASGGGFSNVFSRPAWQERHVQRYLERTGVGRVGYVNVKGEGYEAEKASHPPGTVFNLAGRGYPDVAAVGENFRLVLRGYPNRMHGTSVAVPIWASILTLINEERLAANKSTVGFVHQVLYDHPEVFTDITRGSNPGCGSKGFEATEGWDPVTGLGTPIFPKLLELFMSLP